MSAPRYAVEALGAVKAVRLTNVPRSGQTVSGYGRRLPTSRLVLFASSPRWYRVYVACYSNSGTAYVRTGADPFLVVCDSDLPEVTL